MTGFADILSSDLRYHASTKSRSWWLLSALVALAWGKLIFNERSALLKCTACSRLVAGAQVRSLRKPAKEVFLLLWRSLLVMALTAAAYAYLRSSTFSWLTFQAHPDTFFDVMLNYSIMTISLMP